MLAVPPARKGAVGVVDTLKTMVFVMFWPWIALASTRLGLLRMSWVIVPALMKLVRSWGSLRVLVAVAVWLAKRFLLLGSLMTNGVISTAGRALGPVNGGGPGKLTVGARHWALMVVPCGIEAIRVRDSPKTGSVSRLISKHATLNI